MNRIRRILVLAAALGVFCGAAAALEFTPQPITGGTYRFKDCSGQVFSAAYIQQYSYGSADVKVTLDPPGAPYLSGLIQAAGLKPSFAYQIKLAGRNSKLNASGSDDATNERLGLIGRWWRAYPNPANAKDDDYFAHKSDPNYAYTGYLIIGFFITDAQGNATTRFEGDNSFHVLWQSNQRPPSPNDGPIDNFVIPATAGNPAYDVSNPAQPLGIYGEWEPTRALPGTLAMPSGHYACDFMLTEESFHDTGANAGNWTAALGAPIDFDIGAPTQVTWNNPADIVYPAPLSDMQLDAIASEPGYFIYDPPAGTVLNAGVHTLSVQFTPYSTNVIQPPAVVHLKVQKGTPNLSWNPPRNVRANMPLDGTILNATCDVPGQFVYNPPQGTWLKAGTETLALQFVPADSANYNTPGLLTFGVEAVTGLLIVSGPWAAPNPAYAGSPVQFGAATEARGIDWTWDFGDGSAPGKGSVTTHTYSAAGIYTATATAQVPHGRNESQSLNVTVRAPALGITSAAGGGDADGDGFSNALELAWGSDPNASNATPLDGLDALSPLLLTIAKCSARLDSAPGGGRYKIELKTTFSVPKDFNAASLRVGVFTCGVARALALEASGRARVDGASFTARLGPVRGRQRLVIVDAAMSGDFTDVSLPNELAGPYAGKLRGTTAMVVLGGNVYAGNVNLAVKQSKRSVIFSALK